MAYKCTNTTTLSAKDNASKDPAGTLMQKKMGGFTTAGNIKEFLKFVLNLWQKLLMTNNRRSLYNLNLLGGGFVAFTRNGLYISFLLLASEMYPKSTVVTCYFYDSSYNYYNMSKFITSKCYCGEFHYITFI